MLQNYQHNFFTGAATYADSNYTPTDDVATQQELFQVSLQLLHTEILLDVSNMNKDYPAKTG